MTSDDVVARAVELCKKEIKAHDLLVFSLTNKLTNVALQASHQSRSWQTHLDEFEEHQRQSHNGFAVCFTCSTPRVDATYPCQIAELKAKRLMGEEL